MIINTSTVPCMLDLCFFPHLKQSWVGMEVCAGVEVPCMIIIINTAFIAMYVGFMFIFLKTRWGGCRAGCVMQHNKCVPVCWVTHSNVTPQEQGHPKCKG